VSKARSAKINDPRVHHQTIEGPLAGEREEALPEMLVVAKARTLVGPDETVTGCRGRSPAADRLPFGISVVLLGRREDDVEILSGGVDLVGSHQTLEEDPAVLTPTLDLVIRGFSCAHGRRSGGDGHGADDECGPPDRCVIETSTEDERAERLHFGHAADSTR